MSEKKVLMMIKSAPFTNLNYYEGLRTAAGFWDHEVSILWRGKGVLATIDKADKTITGKFFSDLPDLDVKLYVDKESMEEYGITEDELVENLEIADKEKVQELLEAAEVSFVF